MSGISKPLPLYTVRPYKEVNEIFNCGAAYIFDNYQDDGFSLLINTKEDYFKFGSFNGEELDIVGDIKHKILISDLLENNISKYLEMLKAVRVTQIQLCFSLYNDKIALTDARPFYNKYLGPGMLRDVIAKCGINIPNIIDIVPSITQEIIDKYAGTNYIIKPSLPKYIVRDEEIEPLSARII